MHQSLFQRSKPMTSDSEGVLEQVKATDYAFNLAHDFDGACPCADFKLKDDNGTFYAHSRCWRVSEGAEQDLYVWGEHPDHSEIAEALKEKLDETEWYNSYKIIYEEFK